MAAVRKARQGGHCVVCRRAITRGQLIETWGGFVRHSACKPPKEDPYAP